jgi:MoxR-like ATPase
VSPRGALALTQAAQAAAMLANRDYVIPDDVKRLFQPVCCHRVVSKTYLHNGDANATARILQAILDKVPTPR